VRNQAGGTNNDPQNLRNRADRGSAGSRAGFAQRLTVPTGYLTLLAALAGTAGTNAALDAQFSLCRNLVGSVRWLQRTRAITCSIGFGGGAHFLITPDSMR
jgi:hypothetical protein